MKKFLCTLITLSMVLAMFSTAALAIGGEDSPAFAPFDETVSVKVVRGYSESTKPGVKPSTCYWNEYLLNTLNIELDWLWEVDSSQYDTKLAVTLASNDYPDMLQCDYQTYNYLKESGALADLSSVWEEYASDGLKAAYAIYDNAPLKDCTNEKGELLAIPYLVNQAERMQLFYWRTDWLENVGLEMPTNIEEFTAAIKAFRDKDPDGNGEKDTYGLAMYSDPQASQITYLPVFYAFESYPNAWFEKDGKIVNGVIQPETKEALDYLRELYAGDYIDPEFATLDYEQTKVDLADSKLGVVGGYWYAADTGLIVDTIGNNENATWEAAAMVGNTSDKAAAPLVSEKNYSDFMVCLSTASEEAKIAMIKILNAFYDYTFPTSVEEGGSGRLWFTRVYAEGSPEYNEIKDKHYAWWCPVVAYSGEAIEKECLLLTHRYQTGEWDDSITYWDDAKKASWDPYIDITDKPRSEVTEDEMAMWVEQQGYLASRINTDDTTCGFILMSDLLKAGNVKINVFYGPETETGNAVGSTLKDLVSEYFNRYIMGLEAEDSWETFVANWNAMGGEIWTQEVNEAYYAIH